MLTIIRFRNFSNLIELNNFIDSPVSFSVTIK